VSQHLRVLRDAGLVTFRREGTQHVYEVDQRGIAEVRAWLDTFWDDALARYKQAVEHERRAGMTDTATTAALAPIEKSVTVECPPERAFTVFTREAGSWWPTDTHALHAGEVERLVWEEREGGAVYELATSGERADWATVLTWEPPHRLVIAWQVNAERLGSEVEVRFTAVEGGTRVDLEHRGFERVGGGAEMRESYDAGWGHVLDTFAARIA